VSWIHAPLSVSYGESEITNESELIIPVEAIHRLVIPVHQEMKNIKLRFNSIGKNPEGTAGAGEDGWLFISEVQVY